MTRDIRGIPALLVLYILTGAHAMRPYQESHPIRDQGTTLYARVKNPTQFNGQFSTNHLARTQAKQFLNRIPVAGCPAGFQPLLDEYIGEFRAPRTIGIEYEQFPPDDVQGFRPLVVVHEGLYRAGSRCISQECYQRLARLSELRGSIGIVFNHRP